MGENVDHGKRFAVLAAWCAALLSLAPMLAGTILAANGAVFLGFPYATDDHMVYAAWMRQAQDGRFFFDNRFAVDPQPGLTIHVYFFILGLASKAVGIAWASSLAKAVFSGLFVWQLHGLLRRITQDPFAIKLMLSIAALGAGVGYLVWHQFGEALTRPTPDILFRLLQGRLPTDVWQPEGFVFPSMLTNGLFMVSLCLILAVGWAIVEARTSWKAAGWGAGAMLVLMNIHSYDVLLLFLVALAFLVMLAVRRMLTGGWFLRIAAIFAGAIPAALWFLHVLRNDPVFQARAATPTYSPNFRAVTFGYLLLLAVALIGIASRPAVSAAAKRRQWGAAAGMGALVLGLFFASGGHDEGMFLGPIAYAAIFAATIALCCLAAEGEPMADFLIAWAFVGLTAMYFPALFQRKLAMGLSVPWALLAGWALVRWLGPIEKGRRNLASVAAIFVLGATSLFWLRRELVFIRNDVSRTTMHPVYLTHDMKRIVAALDARSGERRVAVVVPGIAEAGEDEHGATIPDAFGSPFLADLNPIVSGLTGTYTLAGHWSETPDYLGRREESLKFFLSQTTAEERRALIEKYGLTYAIGPAPLTFGRQGKSAFVDPAELGEVIVPGTTFQLVRLRR